MDTISSLFLSLKSQTGMDFSVLYDPAHRRLFLSGLSVTLALSVVSLLCSLVLGVLGAWLLSSRYRVVRICVGGYVQFFRATPPLIQMYFFYFAIGSLFPRLPDASNVPTPLFGNFFWAAVSLSLFAGAFNVEIFRSGLEAVPRTTLEAAECLGLGRAKVFRLIALPLAFRICLPALNNNMVNVIKTSSLAYAIGVPEVLYVSAQIWSEDLNVREMMTVLLLSYGGLVGILVWSMHKWERIMRIPGYGP